MNQRPIISIGILDKLSSVSGKPIRSRATQGRLIDPAEHLVRQGRASMCLLSIEDLSAGHASADVIFASRPLSDRELECLELARQQGRRVVVDLADNLTVNPHWSKLYIEPDRLRSVLGVADVVSVTNAVLADVYRPYGPPVLILRTGFNADKYASSVVGPLGHVFLFTMCNGDNLKSDNFGEEFAQVIAAFVHDHSDAAFHYYGDDRFPLSESERIVSITGQSFLAHKSALARGGYSLAVMMMGNRGNRDDDFMDGKSPVKYWEHGGMGIPGVFSNGPVYRDVIEPGVNGLLADNFGDDWRKQLEFSYHNRPLLAEIGRKARKDVTERFGISVAADDLYEVASAAVR